jgi:F420-dependent oxidoreductase-like protein
MDIAIMIEGQDGLNWQRWERLARAVEDLGFAGLYRSDHFTNPDGPTKDSLELWVSLTWLAAHTERIDFGPLVTPPGFRHPVFTARYGLHVNELSGDRLHLGLGAGWQEREHEMFGLPLLEVGPRFDRFKESVEVIDLLTRSDEPVSYEGEYYQLEDAILEPRPTPPKLLIGGNGENKTLRYVAQHADMWNAVYITPADFARKGEILDGYLEEEGRPADSVHRSMMTGLWFATEEAPLKERIDEHPNFDSKEQVRERGVVVGVGEEILPQLAELNEAGCQRVMLQWLAQDDLDGLEALANVVLPEYPSS